MIWGNGADEHSMRLSPKILKQTQHNPSLTQTTPSQSSPHSPDSEKMAFHASAHEKQNGTYCYRKYAKWCGLGMACRTSDKD